MLEVPSPEEIACSTEEQYDLRTKTCEPLEVSEPEFKVIVKTTGTMSSHQDKAQLGVGVNDTFKVRIVSQPSLTDHDRVYCQFKQGAIKENDSFTACFKPVSQAGIQSPVCVNGSNTPASKTETV